MSIIWTGLTPHPPIIVEAVGGRRCAEVRGTIDAMKALSTDLLKARPNRLIVLSPHSPRPRRGIGAWMGSQLQGSLASFGAVGTELQLEIDTQWLARFQTYYPAVTALEGHALDHGAMVPLHFVAEAGWSGPTVVLGLPWNQDLELDQIGDALAAADGEDDRTALIASGDMSHCLTPDAPEGYNPAGPEFDAAFVNAIRATRYKDARDLDADLRLNARQDVVESCRVAWRATQDAAQNHHFYHYEGPFGVGYTVMKFYGRA